MERMINGVPYLDGGCADAIPWRRAMEMGCDRVVVVLTRERTYHKVSDRTLSLIRKRFMKYPRFVETMEHRAERYNQSREELFALEHEGKVIVITPESTEGFSRTERDVKKIRALWQAGYFAGRQAAEQVRLFWGE